MLSGPAATNGTRANARSDATRFSEEPAWVGVGDGWRPLHGSFEERGFSIEWHDFALERDLDWSRSFHPGALEICLNLTGQGEVQAGSRNLTLTAATTGFYYQRTSRLTGSRRGGEHHQFVTLEFSVPFLREHLPAGTQGLHPRLGAILDNPSRAASAVSEPMRLTGDQQQMTLSLRRPPVSAAAQRLWYQAKALEFAAALLYQAPSGEEFFCQRQQRLSRERVEKVIALLKDNLVEPLSLEQLGQRVGCSPFYLSRIFTQEMGKTISAHLRDLRMDCAAALLREGRLNVTEVALAVGYSSPSHFSTAFHAAFGCCPGLYPLETVPQATAKNRRSG